MGWSCCLPRVGVIGINYKTADLPLREEIARGCQRLAGEGVFFFHYSTVLLSTCNRTEIYFSAEDLASAHGAALSFLQLFVKEPFEHRLYSYFGIDCFFHLSRVTAGLDSAILVETEIQHQVKMAYLRSCDRAALPGCLHYIFQKALKIGKMARNCLSQEKGEAMLHGTLWRLALQHFGTLAEKKILLLGYSEFNRGFAAFLQHKGIRQFVLVTRATGVVAMEGVIVRGRECLEKWHEFDWIICASASDHYLIAGKGTEGQLIFDLGLPRNVDPAIQHASVMHIEQINQIIDQNRRLCTDLLKECEAKVADNVHRLVNLYRAKHYTRSTSKAPKANRFKSSQIE
ncbi:MAG: glutamyl-tRNA reductase [Chlamydiia bacterium]|nr:glutamyl-tRNA reductase [Chlamydiia bacterium]